MPEDAVPWGEGVHVAKRNGRASQLPAIDGAPRAAKKTLRGRSNSFPCRAGPARRRCRTRYRVLSSSRFRALR